MPQGKSAPTCSPPHTGGLHSFSPEGGEPVLRPCLDCGRATHEGSRCGNCKRAKDRQRWDTKRSTYDAAWRKHSKKLRDAHVATWGWWCPGWGPTHPAHASTDLVVDHDDGVLCRGANALKANTVDRGKPHPTVGGH